MQRSSPTVERCSIASLTSHHVPLNRRLQLCNKQQKIYAHNSLLGLLLHRWHDVFCGCCDDVKLVTDPPPSPVELEQKREAYRAHQFDCLVI
jgi:hypothetical protein